MSQRRGPKITSDPTLGGTKQRAEETEEEIRPEPPLSRNEHVKQNEDNTELNSDLSNNNEKLENNDDTDLDDLFNIESEEELEKIASQGKENYGENDLSNVNTNEDLEIPTYNEDDISQRKGNYILTLGLPRSGKTTVQSFMTYTAKNYSARVDKRGKHFPNFYIEHRKNDDGTRNIDAEQTVQNWDNSWRKLIFPDVTPVGEQKVREIRLRFNNNQNKKQSFDLSFLEVSGEDLNQVRVDKTWQPHLLEVLNKFLQNTNLKYNFVWVIDPRKEDNDVLFTNFMSYFNTLETISKDKIGLMIVISHPQSALNKIREHPNDKYNSIEFEELSKRKNILAVMSLVAPQTLSIYDNWKTGKKSCMLYNIGIAEDFKNQEGKELARLKTPKFQSSRAFIEWHYFQLHGKEFSIPLSKKLLGIFGS